LRDARELSDLLGRLWSITPAPPGDAYQDHKCRYPLTWFKDSAREHVRIAWRISELLRRRDVRIRARASRDPGYILFQDEIQVIVRPHRGEHYGHAPRPADLPTRPIWNGDRATIRRWAPGMRGRERVLCPRGALEIDWTLVRAKSPWRPCENQRPSNIEACNPPTTIQ
jgi:hypothetical protein